MSKRIKRKPATSKRRKSKLRLPDLDHSKTRFASEKDVSSSDSAEERYQLQEDGGSVY